MTSGFSDAVWSSNWAALETACKRIQKSIDSENPILREDLNEARARYHILTGIAEKYGWPQGRTLKQVEEILPISVRIGKDDK